MEILHFDVPIWLMKFGIKKYKFDSYWILSDLIKALINFTKRTTTYTFYNFKAICYNYFHFIYIILICYLYKIEILIVYFKMSLNGSL